MKITNIHRVPVWFLLFGMTLFLITCGDNNPAGGDENPPEAIDHNTVSLEIGPDGGSVTSKDGRVTLDFPEGALASIETITITPIDEDDLGSEFDEVINEFGFGKAYEMGPDGLSFEQPVTVTFQSDQVVTQRGDSVSIFLELLFTNEEGGVAALDSLRMSVDEETGETTLTGGLHHFSFLLANDKRNESFFFVGMIPDFLNVNDTSKIKVTMGQYIQHFDGKRTHKPFKNALYKDLSSQPLQRNFNPAEQELPDPEIGSLNRREFEYTCIDRGLGIYKSEGTGTIEGQIGEAIFFSIQITGLIVQKNVRCVAPPQLKSPANGAKDVELETVLEWEPVEEADGYIVQIAEDGKEFTDSESAEITVTGPDARASGLKPGTTYRWRVRAIFEDSSDDGVFKSEWSEIWTFTTKIIAIQLSELIVCTDDIEGSRYIIWSWAVETTGVDNFEDVTVKLKVILPDGTESFVTYPLYSFDLVFLGHIIYSNGEHKHEVVDVRYKEDTPIVFSGEDLSGSVKVTKENTCPD